MLTHMKPIVACFVLSGILLSAQGLDLSFGFGKRAPDPLPPSQVVRIYGFPTHSTALIEVSGTELPRSLSFSFHVCPTAPQHNSLQPKLCPVHEASVPSAHPHPLPHCQHMSIYLCLWASQLALHSIARETTHRQHLIMTVHLLNAVAPTVVHMLQRQLGELLAAACRAYNKAASCKLHSINVGQQHLRLLDYQHEDERSVVAYVAHDEQRGGSYSPC